MDDEENRRFDWYRIPEYFLEQMGWGIVVGILAAVCCAVAVFAGLDLSAPILKVLGVVAVLLALLVWAMFTPSKH